MNRMKFNNQNKDAFHEAGHLVIASFFVEHLDVKGLTLDPAISKQYDSLSKGGLNLKLNETSTSRKDQLLGLLCICLAGSFTELCLDKSVPRPPDSSTKALVIFRDVSTNKRKGWGGDLEVINEKVKLQIQHDLNYSINEFLSMQNDAASLVWGLLNEPAIIGYIETVADELKSKTTLTEQELKDLINGSGLSSFIMKYKDSSE